MFSKKEYPFDIKKALSESSNLKCLEEYLLGEGIEIKSPKKLKKFLYIKWRKSNKKQIDEIKSSPLEEIKDLPYTEVRRGNTTYKIHGIAHSIPPHANLSQCYKDFVSSRIKSYSSHFKEDYVTELGFAEIFDLDKSHEMNYLNNIINKRGEVYAAKLLKDIRLKMFKYIFLMPIAKIYFKKEDFLLRELYMTLQDPRYLKKTREIFPLVFLPEPFESKINMKRGKIGDEFNVLCSDGMAECMIKYANKKKLKTLHAVVGLYHERRIAYTIKNFYLPV